MLNNRGNLADYYQGLKLGPNLAKVSVKIFK